MKGNFIDEGEDKARDKVAQWMIRHGLATGHGDTVDDLLGELTWQWNEARAQGQHATQTICVQAMTLAQFRNALAKLRFLELPASINVAWYSSDLASIWRKDPVWGFFRLGQPDQDKVFAAISDDEPSRNPMAGSYGESE